MVAPSTFLAWAESLETMTYYEILRVPEDASLEVIQQAFHHLSLRCHPDRFVDDGPEVAAAAAGVFKRAVEAYGILKRSDLRARYDTQLARDRGALKLDEHKVVEKKRHEQRTLFMIARDARAKRHAAKADAYLSEGRLEEARIQLITAVQNDPGNDELKERLDILYEAMMLS